jgi:ribosome-associated protein
MGRLAQFKAHEGRSHDRMTKTEIRRMVAAAAAACEDKKAEQIRILELDPADSGFTDYFLICNGTNDRQNQAIATAIEERMERDFTTRPNSVEGYRQGEWILLDYVDFVVHIFSEEKRDFYNIERLRKTATTLDLEQMKASLTKRVAAVRKKQAAKKAVAKKAPAKKVTAKKAVKKAVVKRVAAKKRSKTSPAKPAKGKATKATAKAGTKPNPRGAQRKKPRPKGE